MNSKVFFNLAFLIFVGVLFSLAQVKAHSGGLDSYGCHAGSKPYHCHSGSYTNQKKSGSRRNKNKSNTTTLKPTGLISIDQNALYIQRQLIYHCIGLPVSFADGVFGKKTQHVLMQFQEAYNLSITGNDNIETRNALSGRPNGKCILI